MRVIGLHSRSDARLAPTPAGARPVTKTRLALPGFVLPLARRRRRKRGRGAYAAAQRPRHCPRQGEIARAPRQVREPPSPLESHLRRGDLGSAATSACAP